MISAFDALTIAVQAIKHSSETGVCVNIPNTEDMRIALAIRALRQRGTLYKGFDGEGRVWSINLVTLPDSREE